MASSAVQAVFDLPEMLEAILLKVPGRDLHISTNRVCGTWHAAIKNSPRIREKLFLRTAATRPVKPHTFDTTYQSPTPCYRSHLEINWLLPPRDDPVNGDEDNEPYDERGFYLPFKDAYELSLNPEQSCMEEFLSSPPCTTVVVDADTDARPISSEAGFTLYDPEGIRFGLLVQYVLKAWKATEVSHKDRAPVRRYAGYLSLEWPSKAGQGVGKCQGR